MSDLSNLTSQWRNPLDHPIDLVLVNNKASPGIATVEGASEPRRWNEGNGYGDEGGILFYTGFPQTHFSVKIRLYNRADWAAWRLWRPLVAKKPKRVVTADGPARRGDFGAYTIWHPFLEELGISAAVTEDILQPMLTDESGEWTIEVKMISFRKPKPNFATPKAPDAPPVPDAMDLQTIALVTENLAKWHKLTGP